MKRKFGIDIDGTVTCPATIVPYLNEAFHLNLTFDDFKEYDWLQVIDVSENEFNDWYLRNEANIYMESPLASGAKEVLLEWGRDHDLVFISARGEELLQITKDWFIRHGLPYHHIELIGTHQKVEAAKKYAVEIFLEDKYDNAIDIYNHCHIPVILFNTPYNQGPLPNKIKRVFSWKEAKIWVDKWISH